MTHVIGFDIGGTKIEAGLVDADGRLVATVRQATPPQRSALLAAMQAMVATLSAQHRPAAIGCSIPGSLDPSTGLLRNAPNSPQINGTPFGADVRALFPLPVTFDNDANCLVRSEVRFGVARGLTHVVGLIMGTGLGAGVLAGGHMLVGARGLAPEPGHTVLHHAGRPCLCGNRGCAEAYLSGTAVYARYREAGGASLSDGTRAVFARYATDPIAARVIAETLDLYARFVAGLIALYDPEMFVLGGGLSEQALYYEQAAGIARYAFGTDQVPPIRAAAQGPASGKLGAAAMALDLLARSATSSRPQ